MAKTYLTNINLKGNQLLNAAIQPSASAPSALTAGQLYYNTVDGIFYFSTGSGTGNWEPVGVQYISAVNSDFFTVTNGSLDFTTTPVFSRITTNDDGNGTNILVGNDAYIGDINVANFVGIRGFTDGTKGGIKFGSAKTETISTDGNNLTLTANNDIVLLPGSDYAYLGTPLIDGSNKIATLGDINSDLTGYVTETGTQNLSNKTFLGDVYFQSGGGAGGNLNTISVDNNTGHMAIASGYELELISVNDVNITSSSGDIVINPDGTAYIGSKNANNRIATISDISNSQSNAEGYADTAATNALNSANSYTDAAISSEVSRANSAYDPAGSASSAQTAAQSYADTAATNAENSAKSYADSLASNYDPAGSATTAENNAKSYTDTKVADLVGMAPSLLDTLEKIDNAIANDANFSTTLLTDIATAQATAESYTDSAISTEVTSRNSAIATAKSEAITEAEGYTDSQLSTFGNQTSTDISNAITTAENYADNLVTSLALTSKYVGSISGDGTTDTFTITHNLGKRSVMVQVYQSSGSPDTQWADVEVDMTRISTNAITIGMGVPPTAGTTYEVVIVG